MSGLIPDPPPGEPDDWAPVVLANIAFGIYGGCVMCPEGTYDWFDLTLADLPPVVDRTGTPTDQVAIHLRCVPDLVAYWTMLTTSDPDVGDRPETPRSVPDVGVLTTDDPFERERRPARARVGAYARRGGS